MGGGGEGAALKSRRCSIIRTPWPKRVLSTATNSTPRLPRRGNALAAFASRPTNPTKPSPLSRMHRSGPRRRAPLGVQPRRVERETGQAPRCSHTVGKLPAPATTDYRRLRDEGRLLRKLDRDVDVLTQLEAASTADPHNSALKLLLARISPFPAAADGGHLPRSDKRQSQPGGFKGLLEVYKDDNRRGGERLLRFLNKAVQAVALANDRPHRMACRPACPRRREANQAAVAPVCSRRRVKTPLWSGACWTRPDRRC